MELRDYIAVWKKQAKTFWTVVVVIILGVVAWQQNQPTRFEATLLLNIGRSGGENTGNYTYDGFYRLQADERFADTVVRWLGSPRVVDDIYTSIGLDTAKSSTRELKNTFVAKRLSSQMIEVTYSGSDKKVLTKISEATVSLLNQYTTHLDTESKETNWFVVIGSDPVIRDARVTLLPVLMVGIILGIFIGFWGALMKHYLSEKK